MNSPHTANKPSPTDYERLLREALEASGTSVWEWNPITDQLFGVEGMTTLLGVTPDEESPTQDHWERRVQPDDNAETDKQYQRHARGETPFFEHEYRARAKDGSWKWILERGRVVERLPDGRPVRVVGTLSDVTQRHEAQERERELTERLQKISRHVPGMVYQFRRGPDGSDCYPYVSQSCIELIGLTPSQLTEDAAALRSRIDERDTERVLESIDVSRRDLRPWHCEFRVRRVDGELRWFSGSSTPQAEPDGGVLWHGYMQDVTDLRELSAAREAAATSQAANRAKTDFLSRMSHELRTPLNAVMGFAQLLERDKVERLTPNQRRRVTLIHEAGEHLLQMIGELLDLTRIEAGQLSVSAADVPLTDLLSECVDLLRPSADAASVLLAPVLPDPDCIVRADATRLRQVVLNLLANAVKYNRPQGTVQVLTESLPDGVAFHVIDTGVGISPEHVARIGEPFNRLAHKRSAIEGTGIGLAVTLGLIEKMGGRLRVQSTLGAGSTFSVVLPSGSGAPPDGDTTQHAHLPD
jgi:PAS domain S-box-containing protein